MAVLHKFSQAPGNSRYLDLLGLPGSSQSVQTDTDIAANSCQQYMPLCCRQNAGCAVVCTAARKAFSVCMHWRVYAPDRTGETCTHFLYILVPQCRTTTAILKPVTVACKDEKVTGTQVSQRPE